jgi:hypothetical protein
MVAQLPLHGMDDFITVLSASEAAVKLYDRALAQSGGNIEAALPAFQAAWQAEPVGTSP